MNFELLRHNLLVCCLVCIPAILIDIKMIIYYFFKIKYHIISLQYSKMCRFLKKNCPNTSYSIAAEKLNVKERYDYLNDYRNPKIVDFIEKYLVIDSYSLLYSVSAVLFQIAAIVSLLIIWVVCDDFMWQRQYYDNGNFSSITKYYNYEELPQWGNDSYAVCMDAEEVNEKFFTKENKPKYRHFQYILKDEFDKIHPIDTDQMWLQFLFEKDIKK